MTEHARLDPDTGGLLVSERAWQALRAIGAEETPADADMLEALEELGLVRDERLEPVLGRAMQAVGAPLAGLTARRRGLEMRGWMDAEAALVLVPRGGELSELSVVAVGYLPDLLARLLDLGPRQAPVGDEVSVAPGVLAQAIAGPGRQAPADGLPGLRDHWEVEISASAPPRHSERLEIADTDDGLREIVSDGAAVRISPTTPSRVWRLLTAMVAHGCGEGARPRPGQAGG